ncbi:class I SAM-dependent methyltransferase [Moraxella atlantae]
MPPMLDVYVVQANAATTERLSPIQTVLAAYPNAPTLIPRVLSSAKARLKQKDLQQLPSGCLLLEHDGLSLLSYGTNQQPLRVAPHWLSLQQRVVAAGKKSELLLKAAKIQPSMRVLDATAGFGHDSLILASTGASVTMLEREPALFVLLAFEGATMQQHAHWHRLLARLTLYFTDFTAWQMPNDLPAFDRVLLDPMFPTASYTSAVNKHMQALHTLTLVPNFAEQIALLQRAANVLTDDGRVLVKRPKTAPFLADLPPQDSTTNALIRFDSYHKADLAALS